MKHAVLFQVVHLFPSQMVPCARFINILKNTPGACGFKRPEGYVQVSKAEIIKRLVALNIPVYEVDPKVTLKRRLAVFLCLLCRAHRESHGHILCTPASQLALPVHCTVFASVDATPGPST